MAYTCASTAQSRETKPPPSLVSINEYAWLKAAAQFPFQIRNREYESELHVEKLHLFAPLDAFTKTSCDFNYLEVRWKPASTCFVWTLGANRGDRTIGGPKWLLDNISYIYTLLPPWV
ncbi:uncharacterized protein MCYG_03527 [Microsporum canis CBS 113480]|uniref:Uncharacterized protein n=1 Tax=Arthroderma otae (strain ATCC MYA-4605 / CBS 113480) TaxID=554155 RepID=C5FLY6_ARTOC|nr:uncharacterized protein MCYG_03527 [Microsporum canis CBS 113480]EEQ30708.1 predicted protein [Microsporum canis CBS 113480]